MKTSNSRRQELRTILCFAALVSGGLLPVSGVVDANSTTNITGPPNGAPWANIGSVNGSSGIYVGAGWALTPFHVGPGNIDLNGTVFPFSGTYERLTNSDGSVADLVLFRLAALPALPRLALASRRPLSGSDVDLLACGRIAGTGETELGDYTGFYWSAGQYKSWGNNRVNLSAVTINVGFGKVTAFTTDFTAPGLTQTSHEAQAAQGDSGGGVFQLNGQSWQLAGMISAISNLPNQPAGSAAYGNSTYAADIATYSSQIAGVMASVVPSLAISASAGEVLLSWADTGATYQLEASLSVTVPLWSPITPSLTLSNGQYHAVVPAGGRTRFFRLSRAPGS
jgi:hypothetical protein